MAKRAYNFNAGPAALPLAVLEKAQSEFVDFQGTGMSIMEMSHRGAVYEAVHNEAKALLLELLGNPEGYEVLFLQGGATTQFSMVPMNLLKEGQVGCYVNTGSWAEKALEEAVKIGETSTIASSKEQKFAVIPSIDAASIPANAAYVHITTNNTIEGSQFQSTPDTGQVPLIADMSSDILCKPIDATKYGLIYAGAQKNLGPSGVTIVIAKQELLQDSPKSLPTMLRYSVHAKNNSLYNTPPSFSIYMVKLVLEWVKAQGGLEAMQKHNEEKAKLIYDAIDHSNGFYTGTVEKEARSLMNITFRLPSEELEKAFAKASEAAGFVGLKGHRSVGGMRASTYNAVPREACEALAKFMEEFRAQHA